MGLRERKAAQTREKIINEAMRRFLRDGYEQTTLESVADAVDVSLATIYRYFGSKEMIVLESYRLRHPVFEAALTSEPVDEDLTATLGRAVRTVLTTTPEDQRRTLLSRDVIDQAQAARARLWDDLARRRAFVADLIAERSGAPAQDPAVQLSARIFVLVLETAGDLWRANPDGPSTEEIGNDLLRALHDGRVVLPDPDL